MILNRYLTLFIFFLSNVIYGQELKKENIDSLQTNQLEEVVITATRTEKKVSSVPLPILVITADDIAKTGTARLNEILAEQTGLLLTPSFGGGEGIQIQGLDAAYTLILIDGVPLVGRSAGTLDLSRISVGNIERIEVVKGASSSLYGSDALAGVINIITKKTQKDKFSGDFAYRQASFDTKDASLNLDWKKRKLTTSIFGNYFSTSGYNLDKNAILPTVEPYSNMTINPKIYYDFSENLKLFISTRFYKQKQDNRSIILGENYQGISTIQEWNAQTKLTQKWNEKITSEYEIYATNYKADEFLNNRYDQLFEQNYYNQWLFRPEIRTHFSIQKSKLTTGIGLNYETLDRTYFGNQVIFNAQYMFAQYDWTLNSKVNMIIGFRYDNHTQYKSQLSPKISLNYKINDYFAFKTSLGYGFKAPDFRQLYFDFTNSAVGYTVLGYNIAQNRLRELEAQGQIVRRNSNIDFSNALKPESSLNFNMGISFQKDKVKIELNTFYNAISNLIDTKVIAQKVSGQNVFSYFNIDKIFTYGLELNTTYLISNGLKLSFGYQYLIAKDNSVLQEIEEGKIFARNPQTLQSFKIKNEDYFGLFNRSRHTANIKIFYQIPKINTDVNLRVFYRSKYGLFDTNNNQILDNYDIFVKSYFLTNLYLSKTIKKKYTIQTGANNIFNFTNPAEISNISGRLIFLKLQIIF